MTDTCRRFQPDERSQRSADRTATALGNGLQHGRATRVMHGDLRRNIVRVGVAKVSDEPHPTRSNDHHCV